MQKQVRNRPDLKWVGSYCSIVSVSFLALLINGAFVNMEYFDLPYHLVAIVASLKVICAGALKETVTNTQETAFCPELAESVV
jgi:putative inorganic carbon (hco3(-)) transporter